MGQILIRNLDDDVIARLKARARTTNTSLEQTARDALAASVAEADREDLTAFAAEMRARTAQRNPKLDVVDAIRKDRDSDHGRRWR